MVRKVPTDVVVALVLAAVLGLLAVGWLFLRARPLPEPTGPPRIQELDEYRIRAWPTSAPVARGRRYVYEVGHCGLAHLTDFGGSFWEPLPPSPEEEPPAFFHNEDRGTITLLSEAEAQYESSGGGFARLRRLRGPVTTGYCL